MKNKVLFVYHYDRDSWRANRVLLNWNAKGTWDVVGGMDLQTWQNVKIRGGFAVNRYFTGLLDGTCATVVLYGPETSRQNYVQHTLEESIKRGNGILAIDIHNIQDQDLKTDAKGENPLHSLPSGSTPPAGRYQQYDWVTANGPSNLESWLLKVAKR